MKNNALSLTALVLTAQAYLFSLLTLALSNPLNRLKFLSARDVIWACVAVTLMGTLFGALTFRRSYGRISALAGGVLLIGLLILQL